MLIDATDLISGRLGSFVAKQALLGETVDIINAEKAVISGRKETVLAIWQRKVSMGTWAKGPHYNRNPERLLKRLFRDMLPYKTSRGMTAFKRIMCYYGVPDEFKDKKAMTIKEANCSKLPSANYMSFNDIAKLIGGRVD